MLEWGAVCKVLLALCRSFSATGGALADTKTGLLALALSVCTELKVSHVAHLADLMAGGSDVVGAAEITELLESDRRSRLDVGVASTATASGKELISRPAKQRRSQIVGLSLVGHRIRGDVRLAASKSIFMESNAR